MLRNTGAKSTWGATSSLRDSAPMTFSRGGSTGGAAANVVQGLFALLPDAALLHITWSEVLYFRGAEVHAGKSWVSGSFKGERIIAFIPAGGIFSFKDKFWFVLHMYPSAAIDKYGLLTCDVPRGYVPTERIVWVHSANFTDVSPLWPSMRVVRGKSVFYRFVSLL